jgi:hypothetical protein
MLPDKSNPYTAQEVAETIRNSYPDEDVEVIIIPNIDSVNYGRGVGYEIIEHTPPDEVAEISATNLREEQK